MIPTLLLLTACEGGTIDLSTDPTYGRPLFGMIGGEPFTMRHASTSSMIAGHDRFGMVMLDIERPRCEFVIQKSPGVPYHRVGTALPLEIGEWAEHELEAASMQFANPGSVGQSFPVTSGWIRNEDFENPWEEGGSFVTGALEFHADDGSWVKGRFEEVPLCYQGR